MKLNALLKTLGFLALAATPVVAGTAPAPKNPIAPAPANDDLGINASLGYDTNYVWRGLNFGQHWLSAGLDGSILLAGGASEDGAGSTSLNWDVNYGFAAGDQDHFDPGVGIGFGDQSFERLQLGAAFVRDFGAFSGSLGYRYYRNMGGINTNGLMNDGQEVQLGLATSVGPVDLSSSANWDWVNDSWYFDLGASTTIAVTEAVSVVPFATIGYGHNMNWQFAQDGANRAAGVTAGWNNHSVSSFTAVTAGLRFPVKLNSRATLTPYIAINAPMSGVQNLPVDGTPDNYAGSVVYGGVSLTVRF